MPDNIEFIGYKNPSNPPEDSKMVILYDGFYEYKGRFWWGEYRISDKYTILNGVAGWREIDESR